jgi:D-alanyl-D-alanine carboxypeptidase
MYDYSRRLRLLVAATALATTAPTDAPARYDVDEIKRELDAQCADGRFSGVVVIRVRGKEILDHACGMADILNGIANTRETRFKIYSTSKFITGLTVMALVEQGKISLDQSISAYVTGIPAEWAGVTIRQLLNHSSGIPDLTEKLGERFTRDHPSAMSKLLADVSAEERALKSDPGAAFAYNNFGFELLASAVASATNMPFADAVAQQVFIPAGMTRASIEEPNIVMGHPFPVSEAGLATGYNGAPEKLDQAINYAFIQLGAGAIRATVDDFIALDTALREGKIVSPQSLDAMTLISPGRPKGGEVLGLGVFVREASGVRMHGHTGGTNGYISSFQRYPDDDAMLIALTNRGFVKTRWLSEGVAKMLADAR